MTTIHRFQQRGLRVLHQHIPGPLTAIALSIRAGARFDGRHPGIAHMAEHMLFQGTRSLDQVALNRRAAELGGEHNADTGYETISLTFEVFNEDLDGALGLLAEQFYHSEISDERFRKERRVVIDEIRGRLDDPADRLHTRAWARFYDEPLAHPVCGSIQSIRAMTPRHVSSYLRRYFTHAQSALAVVGGARPAAVERATAAHFTHGSEGTEVRAPRVRSKESGHLRLRGGGGQAYLTKMMAVPRDPRQLIAVGIALDLVGADPDSHLFQEVRERLGLGYEVSASLDFGSDWAVAQVSASSARGAAGRLERAVEETCRRAAEQGFTGDELQRARKKIRYRYASLAESRFDRALALAEGALTDVPIPEEAQRIAAELTQSEIETAWREALTGHTLTAIIAD